MEQELKKLLRWSRSIEVSKTPVFIHNFINLGLLTVLLAIFYLTCWVSEISVVALIISPLLFGLLFFSFFILVVHEGSHLMFVVTKNIKLKRLLNRIFSYPIAALSFQDYVEDWEKGHIEHHRNPVFGGDRPDPQNCPEFIHDQSGLKREIKKILLVAGYAFFKQNSCVSMDKKFITKRVLLGIAAWSSLLLFNSIFFSWWLIIPQLISANVTMILNLIKVSMEHGGVNQNQDNPSLRSRSSVFFGDKIIMPLNIALHFEHHLNMHVPWYRLPTFYQFTKENSSRELAQLVH